MLTSPPEIFGKAHELKSAGEDFVLTSVIAIRGAASAKTGAKAIFDRNGKNILGWVGGGCAEAFLARQALEVLEAKTPRIVTVDLDDEVFGLMPCGGVMDVYLEPHFAAPELELPSAGSWNLSLHQFVAQLGYHARVSGTATIESWRDIFKTVAIALAHKTDRALVPWRNSKGDGEHPLPTLGSSPHAFCILGQTRITEELSRLAKLLNFKVQVFAQNPREDAFPVGTSVCELPIDVEAMDIPENSFVVVASHHQLDHKFIAHALSCGAEYVALVASEKRTDLILEDLKKNGFTQEELNRFFAPAGLVLPGETPTQIAFSILCEVLFLQEGAKAWI